MFQLLPVPLELEICSTSKFMEASRWGLRTSGWDSFPNGPKVQPEIFFTGANKNETEKIHVNQSFMNLGFQHVGFQGCKLGISVEWLHPEKGWCLEMVRTFTLKVERNEFNDIAPSCSKN